MSRIKSWMRRMFLQFAFKNDALYLLYLFFIERSFHREIMAVRAGRAEIQRRIHGDEGAEFRLRRNIHRLEKGLIMRPRRSVFARDYIGETFEAFQKVWSYASLSGASFRTDANLRWYRDVLQEYFAVVKNDPSIDSHKTRFQELMSLDQDNEVLGKSIPRKRKDYPDCRVEYDDLLKLAERRRSVRWYLDKKVPRALIDKAIAVSALSPSACNRQPFRFLIFDEATRVERIASLAGGTKGFAHQFPMIVVVVGRLDAYENPRDRHLIYIDGALAAMSFMFALETLELSSCAINWPDIERRERAIENELALAPHQRTLMLISVGYADPNGYVPFSEKKAIGEIREFQPS